jgi:hypothetical protein
MRMRVQNRLIEISSVVIEGKGAGQLSDGSVGAATTET